MSQAGKFTASVTPVTSIITIDGDVGSVTGSVVSFNATPTAGSTVQFNGAGTTMLFEVTDALSNTLVGNAAGNGGITGSFNTGLGKGIFSALVSGQNNSALGYSAGHSLVTGSNNIYVGLIDAATTTESNTTRIGNTGTTDACYILGIDSVNVGSVTTVVTEAANQLGTAVLTAGSGTTITPAANIITIASSLTSVTWSVITANQTAAVNNGYFCNKGSTLALALPATSAVGDIIEVANENTALGVQFTQSTGQQILIGTTNTTSGATGTLTSSEVGDTLKLVCKTANTIWRVTSGWGNWTPA